MGFWFTLFMWAASFIITDYFRPRLPSQTPAGLGDFNIPTATEGRYVPIMTGKLRVNGPNCTWYGDYIAEERFIETGTIFRRDEVIGYTYFLAIQYAQVHNEVAGITGIWIGDDKVYEGAAATVVDVDRDDLFGGLNEGGGFIGRFRLFNGAQDQSVSTFLSTRISPLPAYRGTAYVMITDIAETGGANIGEAARFREIRVELQAFDTVANGALGDVLGLGNDRHIIGDDINPISFAYEVYTNTDWGGGYPPAEFNLTNFREAAETCFTEGIGMSRLYDDVIAGGDIISEIEKHIDGYIGPNPLTGQIEVILVRNDYTLANEFQATASNVLDVPKWSKSDWSQTINEISLQYADRAKSYKDTFAKARSLANRIIQGRAVTDDLRMPTVHTASVANKIVWRLARSRFRALTSGTVELDRTAWELRPGSVLSLTDESVEETDLACRVTAISKGDLTELSISASVVQDTFGNEVTGFIDPPASDFVPPVQSVSAFAAADQAATTPPRSIMQFDDLPTTVPRIISLARRASAGNPTFYEVIRRVRTDFGTGSYGAYESSGEVNAGFCTCGELRNAEGAWVDGNGSLTMQIDPIGAESLDILIGTYAPSINSARGLAVISPGEATEEWVAFSSIVDDGAGIRLEGLYRSIGDTHMNEHAVNARIWFVWTGGLGMPVETYTPGNGVEVKLLPNSPSDSILEPAATAIAEIEITDPIRVDRPLVPRTLLVNGTAFPTTEQHFDTAYDVGGGSFQPSMKFDVVARLFTTPDIIEQTNGLGLDSQALTDSVWAAQNATFEYWLYDLDTTPSPVRGVDELATGTVTWDTVTKSFYIQRSTLITAGVTADFEARLEIEVTHNPSGTSSISRSPMIFDFDAAGDWDGSAFANVSLLLTPNDADANATITDESDNAHTVTSVGDTQSDTAEFRFAPSSILFDGTGDALTVPDDTTLEFGSNDFTLETWVRYNSISGDRTFMAQFAGVSNPNSTFIWEWLTGNEFRFLYTQVSAGPLTTVSRTWAPVVDTWYHVAVCRDGANLRFFADGTQLGATFDISTQTIYTGSTAVIDIGRRSGARLMDGWFQEMRFTQAALYTADFVPPGGKFARS